MVNSLKPSPARTAEMTHEDDAPSVDLKFLDGGQHRAVRMSSVTAPSFTVEVIAARLLRAYRASSFH